MRALMPYDDEIEDAEASYRRGYQHGAYTVLDAIGQRIDASLALEIRGWIEGDIHEWRIPGKKAAKSPYPPKMHGLLTG